MDRWLQSIRSRLNRKPGSVSLFFPDRLRYSHFQRIVVREPEVVMQARHLFPHLREAFSWARERLTLWWSSLTALRRALIACAALLGISVLFWMFDDDGVMQAGKAKHTVANGEHLILIAQRYGIPWERLALANEASLVRLTNERCSELAPGYTRQRGRRGHYCNELVVVGGREMVHFNSLLPGDTLVIPDPLPRAQAADAPCAQPDL